MAITQGWWKNIALEIMIKVSQDVRVAKPLPIPMAVIGAKYDEFQVRLENISFHKFESL